MKLIAILIFGLFARLAAAYLIPDQTPLLGDISDYRNIAAQFLANGSLASIYRMPLYPLQIALTNQLAGDIALSLVMIATIYLLAKELFSEQCAIISSSVLAIYPPLIFFSVVGLSENTFITLLLLSFLFWYRAQFFLASVFAVLTILTRPIFEPFAPVLTLMFALLIHRMPPWEAIKRLALYAVIYMVLMAPWWVNNYMAYGQFVRLTLGGGEALYAGNNPDNLSGGGNLGEDFNMERFKGINNPIERDDAARNAAIGFIYNNPSRFLKLGILKMERFWHPWPINAGYQRSAWMAGISYLPVFIFSIIGMLMTMNQRIIPIFLFGFGYTLVHAVLIGTIRYRLPLEPFMIIFASYALLQINSLTFNVQPVKVS